MEKYKEIKSIGDGAFGSVIKAQNTSTGEIVAIKKMKQSYTTWDECMNLRELKALRKLIHINIIKLKEVVRVSDQLHFVFEYIDTNIYQLYFDQKQLGKSLPEEKVRSIFYQITSSLAYVHKNGFFHRDLKPENILLSEKGLIKLIDFGLAREIRSRPPYTDYVSTRWYRAPECLLRSTTYNSPVDIFALGCIIAELFQMKPLFNGSSEIDQLNKIVSVLGTPSKTDWPDGYRLASQKGYTFQQYNPIPLDQIITNAPSEAISLISEMLKWDPLKRPTAQKILSHPYFQNIQSILPAELSATTIPQQNQNANNNQNVNNNTNSNSINQKKSTSTNQKDPVNHPPQRRMIASREGRENIYTDSEKIDTMKDCEDSSQFQQSQQQSNKKPLHVADSNQQQQVYQQPSQQQQSQNNNSLGELTNRQNNNLVRNSKSQKHMELDTIYEFLNNGEIHANQKSQFHHFQQQNIQPNIHNKNQLGTHVQSINNTQLNQERLNQKKLNINYQQLSGGSFEQIKQKTNDNIENNYYYLPQDTVNQQNNQIYRDRNQRASSLQQPNGQNKPHQLSQYQDKKNEFVHSALQTTVLNREGDDILGKYVPSGNSSQGQRQYNPSPPPLMHQKQIYVSNTITDMPNALNKLYSDSHSKQNEFQSKTDTQLYNFGGIPKPMNTNNIQSQNKHHAVSQQSNSFNSQQKTTTQSNNEMYNFNNITVPPRQKNI